MSESNIIAISRANSAHMPVTTARYVVQVVMNEDTPNATEQEHVEGFVAEFQSALDAGYFTSLRYDAMTFEVTREVLDVAPAGAPDEEEDDSTPGMPGNDERRYDEEEAAASSLNPAEAQELHEAIGVAIETGDTSGLSRARELAAVLVADSPLPDNDNDETGVST
jgi:hypothetical protein